MITSYHVDQECKCCHIATLSIKHVSILGYSLHNTFSSYWLYHYSPLFTAAAIIPAIAAEIKNKTTPTDIMIQVREHSLLSLPRDLTVSPVEGIPYTDI